MDRRISAVRGEAGIMAHLFIRGAWAAWCRLHKIPFRTLSGVIFLTISAALECVHATRS
jgi:hypothetical protein